MRITLTNLKSLHKSKLFYVVLLIIIVISASFFFYFEALSFDGRHDNLNFIEQNMQASLIATADPTMPEGGVREKGYHIHVNLDTKQLYVYKDGQFVKSYPCSGGKSTTPSPEGSWKVINKAEWGEGFGGAWMGFNVPWGTLFLEYYA